MPFIPGILVSANNLADSLVTANTIIGSSADGIWLVGTRAAPPAPSSSMHGSSDL